MKLFWRGVIARSLLGGAATVALISNSVSAQGGVNLRIACGSVGNQLTLCKRCRKMNGEDGQQS
jgi:hypothetical protein